MSIALVTFGLKLSILGYISIGDIVPDVNITFLYFSNNGLVAIDASRQ
jgi:hypothetical protein